VGSPSVGSGVLTLPCTSSGTTVRVTSLDMDCGIATVELVEPPSVGNGSTWVFLSVGIDGTHTAELFWLNEQLWARNIQDGVSYDATADTYDPDAHRWLRIQTYADHVVFS